MHLPRFEYFVPKTVEDTCSLLSEYKGEAQILAGGTDLLVKMKNRKVIPPYLINIKNVPDLDYICYSEEEGLSIGALSTLEALKTSATVQERFGILAQAAGRVGSVAIRNQGTIGGNICNAAPSAETAPALIALAGKAKIVGHDGERIVALKDFFTGPGETVLQIDDILTEIQIPAQPWRSGGVYLKYSLRQMDIAIVGVAVVVRLDGEVCADIKIVLGAVASTPIRARNAEAIIRGQEPHKELMETAAEIASRESHPIDDIRSSAEHRREIVSMFTAQAIGQAVEQAKLGGG